MLQGHRHPFLRRATMHVLSCVRAAAGEPTASLPRGPAAACARLPAHTPLRTTMISREASPSPNTLPEQQHKEPAWKSPSGRQSPLPREVKHRGTKPSAEPARGEPQPDARGPRRPQGHGRDLAPPPPLRPPSTPGPAHRPPHRRSRARAAAGFSWKARGNLTAARGAPPALGGGPVPAPGRSRRGGRPACSAGRKGPGHTGFPVKFPIFKHFQFSEVATEETEKAWGGGIHFFHSLFTRTERKRGR